MMESEIESSTEDLEAEITVQVPRKKRRKKKQKQITDLFQSQNKFSLHFHLFIYKMQITLYF